MNGSTGIQPTVELATTNGNSGFYPYPVYPMMSGYGNNGSGFFGGDGIWAIILLALIWGGNGNNGWGGFGGGFDNGYAWLSNGQKDIMTNTNNGFDTLHLSNQVEGVRDGISSLATQLCNCCADMTQTVSNGFYNAEISANNRQMADMQQNFELSRQFADCCCENRLGIANLNSTILAENCADRAVLQEGVRDIITNATANTQRILDQLCNDKIDAKNEKIVDLQRELLMKDLQASQLAQNVNLSNDIYNRLKDCPVGTTPVYGNQPIFTCPNNLGSGCGCGNSSFYGSNII